MPGHLLGHIWPKNALLIGAKCQPKQAGKDDTWRHCKRKCQLTSASLAHARTYSVTGGSA